MNRWIEWILMPISVAVVLAVAIAIIKTARADEKLWLQPKAAQDIQEIIDCNDWVLLMGYVSGYNKDGTPRIKYCHYTTRDVNAFLTDDFLPLSSQRNRIVEAAAYFHIIRHEGR